MSESPHDVGLHGREIVGPPWILGRRGSPLEAPENTLVSLRRAVELGLDGVAYELRATRTEDLVLAADETLDRTTDGEGRIGDKTLPELADLDAGGWFDARFKGERLAVLEEALTLRGSDERGAPQHVIELTERGLVARTAELVRELAPQSSIRVASFARETCLEVRDAGLPAMLLAHHASERDLEFVRDERLDAYATGAGGWRAAHELGECSAERWAFAVDDPEDLLAACRAPLNGFTTHEPLRALATRALVRLAPHDEEPYPVRVSELEVIPGTWKDGRAAESSAWPAAWMGAWEGVAHVRNPFAFPVRCVCGIIPRRGAFDIEDVPVRFELGPSEHMRVPYKLAGGSSRPGGDPLFFATMRWRRGPGRAAGGLIFDAPLSRVRIAVADVIVRRLDLLKETRRDPDASMTLRRHRQHLLVSIENPGGLADARTIVHLDGRFYYGGRGVRAPLPEDFDQRTSGIAFSCGLSGMHGVERVVRRWAGGVPDEISAGVPGRLLPLPNA